MRYKVVMEVSKVFGVFGVPLRKEDIDDAVNDMARENDKSVVSWSKEPQGETAALVTAIIDEPKLIKADFTRGIPAFVNRLSGATPVQPTPAIAPAVGFAILAGTVILGTGLLTNWTIVSIEELAEDFGAALSSDLGKVVIGGVLVYMITSQLRRI